jgi:long-chain fatty acid transport protein
MAQRASIKTALVAGVAFGAIGLGGSEVQAGGFYIHEQGAYFQGTSFAGSAAGGPSLSAMFWNPATITQHGPGLTSEVNATAVFPKTSIAPITATSPTGVNLVPFGESGDIGTDASVPASYYVYGLTDRISLGIGVNAPFGLNTKAGPIWSGMFYSTESDVFSLNANPNIAIKVTDWLSVGVGAQIQYFKVKLHSLFPNSGVTGPFPFFAPIAPDQLRIDGDGWDFGFTAGVTITPTSTTTIGLGYRSFIDQRIEGDVYRPPFTALVNVPPLVAVPLPFAFVNFKADVPLPDIATLSIRQKITDTFMLMGTVEWTNWSRLGRIPLEAFGATGAPVPVGAIPGIPADLAFEWRDGWFFSGGFEYQLNPRMALRGGVAWEESPITEQTRGTRLPDNDRLWVSVGASLKWSDNLSLDIGYSHIFVDKTPITITAASGNPTFNAGLGTFIGEANANVDIVSLALRYRFAPAVAAPPPVITKG